MMGHSTFANRPPPLIQRHSNRYRLLTVQYNYTTKVTNCSIVLEAPAQIIASSWLREKRKSRMNDWQRWNLRCGRLFHIRVAATVKLSTGKQTEMQRRISSALPAARRYSKARSTGQKRRLDSLGQSRNVYWRSPAVVTAAFVGSIRSTMRRLM